MSRDFEKIVGDYEAFRSGVARCHETKDVNDIRDAYGRFYRVRDRYNSTKANLDAWERDFLRKVLEEDEFIEGMGRLRGISEHVETGNTELRHPHGEPFELTPASSAAILFESHRVYVTDVDGKPQLIDHLDRLAKAQERLAKAISKASGPKA